MLRHMPARPQSTQAVIEQITNDALRAAALAPTYMQALDITGAALLAVATLARVEVLHG
ncbi:hypothetical protein [Burkholderia pseudomallei]|uniref:hypothetical protein n=1 Tax=Burkholderia pseudomallei TaxID=28450 RepID=UPI00016B2186|nr:hypothetical protein [Burkholderia pseudomallei]